MAATLFVSTKGFRKQISALLYFKGFTHSIPFFTKASLAGLAAKEINNLSSNKWNFETLITRLSLIVYLLFLIFKKRCSNLLFNLAV
jgi:hypothetical protein